MARFLFAVPPFAGHVNPTLGLGAELLKKKHEVAWLSFDPALEEKIPEGGKFLLLASKIAEDEKERIKNDITDLSKRKVYGLDSLKFLYEDVLIPLNEGILDEMKEFIGIFCPDIIINDQQIFAAAIAAIQKNIPYVTSVTAPAAIKINESLPMVYEWEGEQIRAFQKKHGIDIDKRLDCSSLLTLVYTSKEFFGNAELPDYYKFIGPVVTRKDQHTEFDWTRLEKMGDRPKILITIGTLFDHNLKQQFFGKIIEAFAGEDISVVMISDPDLFDSIPENFVIAKQIPQLELMQQIDAVICHGGHNTVCEALCNALPLVVLPIAYDQSYVAGCVADSGVGIRMNFNRFKASQLRDSLYTVLSDPAYKDRANVIQQSFSNAGGVTKAVTYLENLLRN